MSRACITRSILAASLVLAVAAGCSSGNNAGSDTSKPAINFKVGDTGSKILPLCVAYPAKKMKKVVGGGSNFRILVPQAIGKKGDPVTGQTCSWQRTSPGSKTRTLQIEGRDFAKDSSALATQFDELKAKTASPEDVSGIGDAAFSAKSDQTDLLQVRNGPYLLTLSSRAEGGLKPITVSELKDLAKTAIDKLP